MLLPEFCSSGDLIMFASLCLRVSLPSFPWRLHSQPHPPLRDQTSPLAHLSQDPATLLFSLLHQSQLHASDLRLPGLSSPPSITTVTFLINSLNHSSSLCLLWGPKCILGTKLTKQTFFLWFGKINLDLSHMSPSGQRFRNKTWRVTYRFDLAVYHLLLLV